MRQNVLDLFDYFLYVRVRFSTEQRPLVRQQNYDQSQNNRHTGGLVTVPVCL